jgi:nicotinamide-nucleotide adenylyltransferase
MKKIAFAAMRMQGFHVGHFNLISEMLRDNDIVIIGLGSTQIQRTMQNPYSPSERIQMIHKVFGKTNKIKIIPLIDLGAVHKEEWVNYCMDEIEKRQLPQPTRYYGGCATDVSWFTDAKNKDRENIEVKIIDRYQSGLMSATEVRKSIANTIVNPDLTSQEWKKFVPECLHDFLIEKFPTELTLEYNLNRKEGV